MSVFARGVVVSTLANLASPVSILLASSMVAHLFGPSGRGEIAATNAVVVLAVAAASLGAPEAMTYFVARAGPATRGPALSPLLVILFGASVATTATLAFAPVLTSGDPILTATLRLCSLAILPSMLVALLRGAAAGRQQWNRIAAERICGSVFRVVALAVPFAFGVLTVPLAASVLVFAPILGGLLYFAPPRAGVARTAVSQCEFVTYASSSWTGTIAGMLAARLSQAVMLPLSDAYQLGLFAVAVNLAEVMLITNQAFRDVAFAMESASNNIGLLARASRVSGAIALLTAAVISATSPLLVTVLFGPEFQDAIPIAIALSLGLVLGIPGSVAGMGLAARGRPELRSISLIAGLIANVSLLLLLVPPLGAVGAVIASVATSAITSNLNLIQFRRVFGVSAALFIVPRRDDVAEVRRILRLFGKRS